MGEIIYNSYESLLSVLVHYNSVLLNSSQHRGTVKHQPSPPKTIIMEGGAHGWGRAALCAAAGELCLKRVLHVRISTMSSQCAAQQCIHIKNVWESWTWWSKARRQRWRRHVKALRQWRMSMRKQWGIEAVDKTGNSMTRAKKEAW